MNKKVFIGVWSRLVAKSNIQYKMYLSILGGLRRISNMITGVLDIYRNSALFKVINHMSWVTGEGLYNGSGV